MVTKVVDFPTQLSVPAASAINASVPPSLADRLVWCTDDALRNKIHVMGEAGCGKSRWLGRIYAWQLFLRRFPEIIIDPTGGAIDNFVCKFIRLPPELQKRLLPRIVYVDMSGKDGYVVPFPLYYRLSDSESLYDIAQRFVGVIERLDPHLRSASIEGLNAIIKLGIFSGMLLSTLGYQVTEASDLIYVPARWKGEFERALALSPDVKPAVDFFRRWIRDFKRPGERARRSESLSVKLQPIEADLAMRAMFGASEPGISWAEVVKKRQIVLLDFRHERNELKRRFKLLWCLRSIVDYVRLRGMAGRESPFALVIDEFTQLIGLSPLEQSMMVGDIEELVNVLPRNYGTLLTIAHQSLGQIDDDRIRNCLMSMGIQLIGTQLGSLSAQYLAESFYRYYPDCEDSVDILVEQGLLRDEFMDLGKFQFLARLPQEEGDFRAPLERISIAGLDQGIYPNEERVSAARLALMQRCGRPISEILAEIQARQDRLMSIRLSQGSSKLIVDGDLPKFWGE